MAEDKDVALQPVKGPDMGFAPKPLKKTYRGSKPAEQKEERIQGTWPDLGQRAVKIPTKDYVKLYGMWRGKTCPNIDPQEAAFKFIQSENLQRLNVMREHKGFAKAQTLVPLTYVHGIKVGFGRHAASGVVPTDGDWWEGEIVRNQESPAVSRGSEMSHLEELVPAPKTTAAAKSDDKKISRRRQAGSTFSLSLDSKYQKTLPANANERSRSHLQRPYNFSVPFQTWHAPEWKSVLPRVYNIRTYEEPCAQKDFDRMSIRELLGRPLPPETSRMPTGMRVATRTAGQRLSPLVPYQPPQDSDRMPTGIRVATRTAGQRLSPLVPYQPPPDSDL